MQVSIVFRLAVTFFASVPLVAAVRPREASTAIGNDSFTNEVTSAAGFFTGDAAALSRIMNSSELDGSMAEATATTDDAHAAYLSNEMIADDSSADEALLTDSSFLSSSHDPPTESSSTEVQKSGEANTKTCIQDKVQLCVKGFKDEATDADKKTVKTALDQLQERSLEEDGCPQYSISDDNWQENGWKVDEIFKSQEAVDFHTKSDEWKTFNDAMTKYCKPNGMKSHLTKDVQCPPDPDDDENSSKPQEKEAEPSEKEGEKPKDVEKPKEEEAKPQTLAERKTQGKNRSEKLAALSGAPSQESDEDVKKIKETEGGNKANTQQEFGSKGGEKKESGAMANTCKLWSVLLHGLILWSALQAL